VKTVTRRGVKIHITLPSKSGDVWRIGTLSLESGQFVFHYERGFAETPGAEAISAFPDLHKVYRAANLWAFLWYAFLRCSGPTCARH
jgi:hypothetical protein